MKTFLLLLGWCAVATAAAVTSAQSGNWNAAATWTGGVIPGNGDTATIANGHTVTIPAGLTVTVGSSPADDTGTPAIQCASTTGTGALAVNGTLIFRGPVRECNAVWTVGAGGKLLHDSSQAATPSAAHYTWQVGMANSQVGSKLVATGSAGGRITLGTANANGTVCAAGGACDSGQGGGIQGGAAGGSAYGNFQCYYCDISNWGMSNSYLVRAFPNLGSTADIRGVVIENSVIDNCGTINLPSAMGSTAWFRLKNVVIKNPVLDAAGRSVGVGTSASVGATITCADCRIEDSYIEGLVTISAAATGTVNPGFVIRNVVFAGGTASGQPPLSMGRFTMTDGNWDLVWLENRVQSSSDSGTVPGGTLRRTIYTRSYATNPHFVFAAAVTAVHDGFLAQSEFNNGNSGDVFQITPNGGVAAYTHLYRNGLLVATPGGEAPGSFTNVSGTTLCNGTTTFCPAITLQNNTYTTADTAAIGASGESNTGAAGMYPVVRNNIAWRPASGTGWVTRWSSATAAANLFTTADYNWTWNLTNSGSNAYYGYPTPNPAQYASVPGANDTSGDPQFVEQRTIVGFGKRFKSSIATLADVAAQIRKAMEDRANGGAAGDARFNLADLYNWVRAGYRPRNPGVQAAGVSGARVGALDLQEGSEGAGGSRLHWQPGVLANQ